MVPMLETPRLQLRPLGPADAALYCSLYSDSELMQKIGPALRAETARRAFEQTLRSQSAAEPLHCHWVLYDRSQAIDVGLIGLVGDPGPATSAEIGILLKPLLQARGHGQEAVTAVTSFAFLQLQLDSVHCRHSPENSGARGVVTRLGWSRVNPAQDAEGTDWRWRLRRVDWPS